MFASQLFFYPAQHQYPSSPCLQCTLKKCHARLNAKLNHLAPLHCSRRSGNHPPYKVIGFMFSEWNQEQPLQKHRFFSPYRQAELTFHTHTAGEIWKGTCTVSTCYLIVLLPQVLSSLATAAVAILMHVYQRVAIFEQLYIRKSVLSCTLFM